MCGSHGVAKSWTQLSNSTELNENLLYSTGNCTQYSALWWPKWERNLKKRGYVYMVSWFITLLTDVCIVKVMVFSMVTYCCESWTIKKPESQRIDAFKLWCWRRFLWVPWTARRSNQSILKEINPKYYWKDWCWSWNSSIWPPDVKNWLNGKDPDAGKDWGQKKRASEDEMAGWHHQCNRHEFRQTPEDGEGQGSLACYSPCICKELYTAGWLNSNDIADSLCCTTETNTAL